MTTEMVKMAQKKLPKILEKKEIQKLLMVPNPKSLIGLRNLGLMKLAFNCGLRVSEICDLKHRDLNLETGDLRVANGKGGKQRDVSIPPGTIGILKEWEKVGVKSPYFFSTLKGGRLSRRYLDQMIKRYALKAKINKKIGFHTLRHCFATNFYHQFNDLETLRRVLGHASIGTTQVYLDVRNKDIEEKMNLLHEY